VLISLHEAGELLGVSEKTIRRYVAAGRITGYRLGPRLIRVDRNEVENQLRQIPAVSQTIDGGRAA
jgi:excisionase family DNA binding protein